MNEILYNSNSELDKLPFGAVSAGTKVMIGLSVASHIGANSVTLIVKNDFTGEYSDYTLNKVWSDRGYDRFEGTVPFEDTGLYFYFFKACFDNYEKMISRCGDGAAFVNYSPAMWQLTVFDPEYKTPDWIKPGVFYQIFVDRFHSAGNHPLKKGAILHENRDEVPRYKPDDSGEIRNNDFYGGDLDGVIEKLPYLEELGITCIYLCPIFEAYSNHKYDTGDYMKVDPMFGDENTLRTLCSEAEKRGIKIILDGVFNHQGADSLYFNKYGTYGNGGAYNSKASKYYEWYSFSDWPEKYDSWWGISTLPAVREDSEDYQNFIFGKDGVLRKWLDCGISGWRLDVVDELPDRFLVKLRESIKGKYNDALIIGEVWEDATSKIAYSERRQYLQGHELDGTMNYPFKNAIIDFIKYGSAENIKNTVESICENYPKQSLDCVMNSLGTHDTQRILTVLGNCPDYLTPDEKAVAKMSKADYDTAKSRVMLASILQFALPGVPCIYYGDEAGLEGYGDPFNRRYYPWGHEDKELIDWYKKLVSARKRCDAFNGGTYRTVTAKNGTFSFIRKHSHTSALITVNLSDENSVFEISDGDEVLASHNCYFNGHKILLPKDSGIIIKLKH